GQRVALVEADHALVGDDGGHQVVRGHVERRVHRVHAVRGGTGAVEVQYLVAAAVLDRYRGALRGRSVHSGLRRDDEERDTGPGGTERVGVGTDLVHHVPVR